MDIIDIAIAKQLASSSSGSSGGSGNIVLDAELIDGHYVLTKTWRECYDAMQRGALFVMVSSTEDPYDGDEHSYSPIIVNDIELKVETRFTEDYQSNYPAYLLVWTQEGQTVTFESLSPDGALIMVTE